MMVKRGVLLLLACGALVAAGCGDDNKDKSSSDAPATTAESTPPPAETTAADTTPTEGTTGADTSNPQVQAAVEACQSSINANAQLSAGAKKELQSICKDAASGDANAVKEASKKVCLKILDETGVTGPAADQAKAACEAVAK